MTFKQRRHHTSDCVEKEEEVDGACVEKYIEKEIGCKMPWNTPDTGLNRTLFIVFKIHQEKSHFTTLRAKRATFIFKSKQGRPPRKSEEGAVRCG